MCRQAAAALLTLWTLGIAAGAQSPRARPDPLADLTSETLDEVFRELLARGAPASAAIDALVDFAVSVAPVGTRLLIDGRCHEVQRLQVTGFHDGPHGHAEIDREAGENRGPDIHRVASFERRWDDEYQGALGENRADLRAVVSIGRSGPDALDLEVRSAALCAGDSGEAAATLRCGACGVSGETVTFEVTGGAVVDPTSAATDESGTVRAGVTADEPADQVVLTAAGGGLSTSRALRVERCGAPGPGF